MSGRKRKRGTQSRRGSKKTRTARSFKKGTTRAPTTLVTKFTRGIGVPQVLRTKIEWNFWYNDTGASGMGGRVFRGNGPYDPDLTGVGDQPALYDEFTAMYNKYRVIKSYAVVKILNYANDPISATLYPSKSSTILNTVQAPSQMLAKHAWIHGLYRLVIQFFRPNCI